MFFDTFLVKIYANYLKNTNVPTLEIETTTTTTKNNVFSYTNPDLNSLDSLVKLCELIFDTEEEWSNFVSTKRDSYPSLDFFTIKQLNT